MQLLAMQMDTLPRGSYRKVKPTQQGLTLIEVLVALAIIAIALTAIIKATSENIRGTSYLEEKTVAMYVGEQVVSEIRLGLLPLVGQETAEKTEMLGRDWYWQAEETSSNNPHIKKFTVRVYLHQPENTESAAIITMESYRYVKDKP